MYLARQLAARCAITQGLNRAHLVFQQWCIDEFGPQIENVNRLVIQPMEAPAFIGMHGQFTVAIAQGFIQINHPANKGWAEQPDRAKIHKVNAVVCG